MESVSDVGVVRGVGECGPQKSGAAQRATVLVVEDEDAVRLVVGEILQGEGYVVHEAKNGREALSLLERKGVAVNVLVTDVVMPGMNGLDLAEELTGRDAQTKTIFISGYAEHPLLQRHTANAFYLRKPFSVEALTRIVSQALARK
jgi:two-component system, cell cycle sensor histidine kinase and response regulator CckA